MTGYTPKHLLRGLEKRGAMSCLTPRGIHDVRLSIDGYDNLLET
jgi:hypothetical protein